jgi:hypothetical protein
MEEKTGGKKQSLFDPKLLVLLSEFITPSFPFFFLPAPCPALPALLVEAFYQRTHQQVPSIHQDKE